MNLSEQTRAAIFFALAIAVFLIWSHFFLPAASTPSQMAQKAQTASNSAQQQAASAASAQASLQSAGKPASVQPVEAIAERTVAVENPGTYRVEIANRGGVVRSWHLDKYSVDLVNPDVGTELGWPLSLVLDDPKLEEQANSALYQITPAGSQVAAPGSVTMQWSDGHLSVTKKLDFAKDYTVHLEASVTLDGKALPFAVAWRGAFGDKAVYQASQYVYVFYTQNGKTNLLQYKSLGNPANRIQPFDQGGPMEFAGIEDQYFAAAFIPDGAEISLRHWTQWRHYSQANQSPDPEAQVAVGPIGEKALSARIFIGPKDLGILGQQSPSLEGLINYGWTGIIAKPLLFILQWLHRFIPNYGWVIVIFTILLNMALFPLKAWSFQSTKKMQQVAPEIKSIQDRYKKYSLRDPRKQKMNEEVMAVYSREGINPAGSCLLMLPQIPILWALYRVLAYSIELRHAPWFGWIHDLSARDPYYILPILMAATMYAAQKMTPMPATIDPAQQRMMMLMPLMFVAFFFRYAAGLNLYYLTVNLVAGAQQWYLNKTQPLPSRSKFKKNRE